MSAELTSLDAEAIALFRASTSQRPEWWEFTDLQKDCWRSVARKAREIHAARPTRHEIAEVVLNHWARDWDDPRYVSAVRCGAEGCDWEGRFPGEISEHVADVISGPRHQPARQEANVELAARTLQANTHDSPANSKNWEDMTWQEREPWRDRALMVIKASANWGGEES